MACLAMAKRSPAYRRVRPLLAGAPAGAVNETWREGESVYFAFDLRHESAATLPPFAVLAVDVATGQLLAAIRVEPLGWLAAQITSLL